MRKMVSEVATLDVNRANFRQPSELVTSVLFLECWSVFRNHLLKAQEQVISLVLKVKQAMQKTILTGNSSLNSGRGRNCVISGSKIKLHRKITEL